MRLLIQRSQAVVFLQTRDRKSQNQAEHPSRLDIREEHIRCDKKKKEREPEERLRSGNMREQKRDHTRQETGKKLQDPESIHRKEMQAHLNQREPKRNHPQAAQMPQRVSIAPNPEIGVRVRPGPGWPEV